MPSTVLDMALCAKAVAVNPEFESSEHWQNTDPKYNVWGSIAFMEMGRGDRSTHRSSQTISLEYGSKKKK